jgi:hypothetical protein
MQDKSKLGTRYTCFVAECGTKFYDLNKQPALCPKCGKDQAENPNPDPREAILAKYRGNRKLRTEDTFDEGDEEEEDDVDVDVDDDEDDDDIEEGGGEEDE